VTFSETGREDQDSFFHNLSGVVSQLFKPHFS
jgi:hypothetical protein